MRCYSGPKRVHKASVLISVMCALAIIMMTIPTALTSLRQTANTAAVYYDRRYAEHRISMTVALLRAPVFYCGIAMPYDAKSYKSSFMDSGFEPFCWEGPINVESSVSGGENSVLKIAYGVPSGIKVTEFKDYSGKSKIIKLSRSEDEARIEAKRYGAPKYVKNVVMFARSFPSPTPLVVRTKEVGSSVMQVESASDPEYRVREGDELIYFRAIKVYAESGVLYTDDYRISGIQPRIDGIESVYFDLDKDTKIITMYILAKGKVLHDDEKSITWIENCPEKIVRKWEAKKSRYRRYACKVTWRLANCIAIKDMKEASSL